MKKNRPVQIQRLRNDAADLLRQARRFDRFHWPEGDDLRRRAGILITEAIMQQERLRAQAEYHRAVERELALQEGARLQFYYE